MRNFRLIHWGSRCNVCRDPRISLSLEFIERDAHPEEDELPLVEDAFPSLESRLKLAARSILAYTRFEPPLVRFNALARRLLAEP